MNLRPLIAEAIGTMTLILVGVMAISVGKFAYNDSGLVGIALAHGIAIAVMVSATAAISGGHLNPAVTLGLWVAKKIDSKLAGLYIISQLIGASIGAILGKIMLPSTFGNPNILGIPALHQAVSPLQGSLLEAVGTFFLIFVVLGTLVDSKAPKVGGLFIGLTITMDILWYGPLTGAAINPARWFGPALITGNFANAEVWTLGPIIGGMLAGAIYAYLWSPQPTIEPAGSLS